MLKTFLLIIVLAVSVISLRAQVSESDPKSLTDGVPISYGFVVDNSGSMRLRIDRIVSLVKRTVSLNNEGDTTFLVSFVDSEKITIRQELTSDADELAAAAEEMYIEGGKTAIIDAVKLSLDYLVKNKGDEGERRLRLVLITDGDERESKTKLSDLVSQIKSSNVSIHVIGVSDLKVETKLIDKLTKESGGKKYLPSLEAEFDELPAKLALELRRRDR